MELPSPCWRPLALLSALLLTHPWRHPACARADPTNLEPPSNVQIHIVDPKFTVQWEWHSNATDDVGKVTFSAYYRQHKINKTKWEELAGCHNVTATMCNFATELFERFKNYNVRVRAKTGNTISRWSKIFRFCPDDIAVPGPPSGVHIEPVHDSINLNISPPANLKIFDVADLMYKIEIWKNGSAEQPTTSNVCAIDTIDGLALNATYCFKMLAFEPLYQNKGPFSPVYCTQTSENDWKNRPERVRVDAVNTKRVLKWDWKNVYDKNVTFTVQYLRISCLQYNLNKNSWESVEDCEDIVNTECDVSSKISFGGSYYFRVTATSGSKSPVWSKTVKFNALENTEIGPPSSVNINFSHGLLQITMVPPGDSENKSMADFYGLSYQVFLWKNSSSVENMSISGKETFFTFPNLEPLTMYCLKAQAVANETKKSGQFSNVQCFTTAAGNSVFWQTLAVFISSAVAAFLTVVAICAVSYKLKKWVAYAFFPTCKLPSNIKECLQEQHMNKTYLNYAEEHTETCHVIQNMVTKDDGSQNSKQSSRDSGNYSTEEEPGGDV